MMSSLTTTCYPLNKYLLLLCTSTYTGYTRVKDGLTSSYKYKQ